MKRRAFIAAVAGAAASPLAARAQQSALPLVIFLQFGQSRGDLNEARNRAWVKGLSEAGFNNERNVIIDPVPVPSLDQISQVVEAQIERKPTVICAALNVAVAVKAATSTIPIVFITVDDPLSVGLVGSYSRPGGNVTGVRMRAGDEPGKLIELLHEMVPAASIFGVLVYRGGVGTQEDTASVGSAARMLGLQLHITPVSDENEFEAAFTEFTHAQVGAVLVNDQRYFDLRRYQIIAAANRHKLPAVSLPREFAVAGGLASYGADLDDGLRQAGLYVGRILKGENPAQMPVLQPTKFILAINLRMAKSLDLSIPGTVLARADEVIE